MDSAKPLSGLPLGLSAIALSIATFLMVLDYSIANVSIPYIAGDIGVSDSEGTYVITSFAAGSAISLAMTGWFTKRFGLVRLTMISLLLFALFSWACGVSRDLTFLVSFRFIQGFVAGPLIPASQSLILSIFPKEKKTAALSFWSTIVIVAPVVGPILGGWISYDIYWPWIFFLNVPLALFSVLIIRIYMKDYETKRERAPSDWVGFILLAVGVSTLQFILDKGEQFDWLNSNVIRTCIAITVVSFGYLIGWELTTKNPALPLRFLKIRSYSIAILTIATQYALYFGSVVLVPLWLQEYMGYTPIWAGIAVAPLGIMPILFTWILPSMIQRMGPIVVLAISNLFFAASCFFSSYFFTDVTLQLVMAGRLFFSIGILFMIVPLFALAVRDIDTPRMPEAMGMFHFVRAMSGGFGTSIFTTLWIRRSAFHHSNLAASVQNNRPEVNAYFDKLNALGIQGDKAWEVVNDQVTNQGAMLGINDCFYLMAWIFIALIGILLLGLPKKNHDDRIHHTPSSD